MIKKNFQDNELFLSEQTFSLSRQVDDQHLHEKMLKITNRQRNANKTHNEITPYTCHKAIRIKKKKKPCC